MSSPTLRQSFFALALACTLGSSTIAHAASADAGDGPWGPPVQLVRGSDLGEDDAELGIVALRSGTVVAAWIEMIAFQDELVVSTRTPDSEWSEPTAITPPDQAPSDLKLVEHRNRAMIVWKSYEPHRSLNVTVRRADGTWRPTKTIARTNNVVALDAASDGRGAVVVRTEDRRGEPFVLYRAPTGGWQRTPDLPPTSVSSSWLVVNGDRVTLIVRWYAGADGWVLEAHDWTAGDDGWQVQRMDHPGAPVSVDHSASGGIALGWVSTLDGDPVAQVAYRAPDGDDFELAASPGLASVSVGIDDTGTISAAGIDGTDPTKAVLARLDPGGASWATQTLGEDPAGMTIDPSIDVDLSGWAVASFVALDDRRYARCSPDGACTRSYAIQDRARLKSSVSVAGPAGAAATLWAEGNRCEACLIREVWASYLPPEGV